MATKEQIQALARFDAAMCFRTSNQEQTMTQPKVTTENLTDEQIRVEWERVELERDAGWTQLWADCQTALHFKLVPNTLNEARVRIAAAINTRREGSK